MLEQTPLLLKAVEQFGTPLYVYDLDVIRHQYRELSESTPYEDLRILYAMKANFNPDILKCVLEEGASIDAVSPGDVILARKCGVPAEKILYTANNITDREMALVVEHDVLFNIGSLSRLAKFGQAYPGSRVCLRMNPAVVAGAHEKIRTGGDLTKFGILLGDVETAVEICQRYDLTVVGLHKHTGSGITDVAPFLKSVTNLLGCVRDEYFPNIEFVDFGGGFGVPYSPDESRIDYHTLGEAVAGLMRKKSEEIGRSLTLCYEPGKFLVAEAGFLLTEVNTMKENRGRLIAGTNSGFPQLIRPMFYDAYHHIENISSPTRDFKNYDICGNICETGDRFAADRPVQEICEGDILAICNAGAYCYAMGGVYNLRAMPPEVVIDSGELRLSRRGFSSEELIDQIWKECST